MNFPSLPPIIQIDFTIELQLNTNPISKQAYRMSTKELKKLKRQLQELLDKGHNYPSVSLWGAFVLFVKEKEGNMWICIDYG